MGHLEGEQGNRQSPVGEAPGLGEVDQRASHGQRADAVCEDQAGKGACMTMPQKHMLVPIPLRSPHANAPLLHMLKYMLFNRYVPHR